ncbi:MAG: nucleotidyltransferase domain-containing protein [Candidatus Micrarchaeota archaeon]
MFKKLNLLSKTEVKILNFILEQDEEMYERKIAKKAKVSVGSANSVLKKFTKENLVEKRKLGRMTLYKRNDKSARVRQLKISMVVEFLEKEIVEKIKLFSRQVILFGSCAEGTNTSDSDIDLFILSSEKSKVFEAIQKFSKVSPLILNSLEYSNLMEKDKPLYQRINKGIFIWDDQNESRF